MVSEIRNRVVLAAFGAAAGFAIWALMTEARDVISDFPWMVLTAFVGVGAASFLALMGPLRGSAAAVGALCVGAAVAALLAAGGLRFDDVGVFLDSGHPLFAAFGLTFVALPFVMVLMREGESWRDYPALFDHAWQKTVRAVAAWVFVGAAWLLLVLSNTVLEIVGIDIIERIWEARSVSWVITGALLGLGLAIVYEMRAMIHPALVLRLLRVLLPPVLIVSVIFVAGFVAQGTGGVRQMFNGLSPAAVLMCLAAIAAGLVTTAIEVSDADAVQSAWMRRMTAALAVVLPVLAAVAVFGVSVRVQAYGWTPDRLVAATVAGLLLGYGVIYGAAVLRGAGWMGRIRQGNITMALVALAVTALWFTPLLHPQKISTASQIARFEAQEISVAQLPLYELAQEWGYAGQAGLTRLDGMQDHPQAAALATQITYAREAVSRFDYRRKAQAFEAPQSREELPALIEVRPAGAVLPLKAIDVLPPVQIVRLTGMCGRNEQGGANCIAVVGAAGPLDAPTVFIFTKNGDRALVRHVIMQGPDGWQSVRHQYIAPSNQGLDWALLQQGDVQMSPVQGTALQVGTAQIFPYN